jgi:hypothetical protein
MDKNTTVRSSVKRCIYGGEIDFKIDYFLFQRFMGFERQAAQNKIPPFDSA